MSDTTTTPVVFIHGLWLHATSWAPWIELFSDSGYAPVAPGWPGDLPTVAETRADPNSVADVGIEDVTAHFRAVINGLDEPPVVIGHSFGGMIAQKLLGENLAAAAIGIDAAQIKACCRSRCRHCTRRRPCSRTRPTNTGRSH